MNNKDATILHLVFGTFSKGGFVLFLLCLLAVDATANGAETAGVTFKLCTPCHTIGKGAINKLGPSLNGLDGKALASVSDYKYSPAFNQAAEKGKVWNKQALDLFLKNPNDYISGNNMSIPGIEDDEVRASLVDWLLGFDVDGTRQAHDETKIKQTNELLGASAAAIEGDAEYGEYLSGECVTCHKVGDEVGAIPSIVGLPTEGFIDLMYQYKTEVRDNPVMQTAAKRLGDEELAALAAYFGSLKVE